MKLYRYEGESKPPVEIKPTILPSLVKQTNETESSTTPNVFTEAKHKFENEEDEREAHRKFAFNQLKRSHPHIHKKYHNYE